MNARTDDNTDRRIYPNTRSRKNGMRSNITPDEALCNTYPHGSNDQHIGNSIQLDNIYSLANPSPWKVVNYQIPVPIGDCSAHFLVDKLTGAVQRAFLMDGGTNAGIYAAWAQILKGLRFIDLQLGSAWKFDSWVVTHWDEDHFRGVKDLLVNHEIGFTRCNRNRAKVTRGSPGSFVSLYFTPKPVLLCGAWDAPVMFKGGGDFLRPFVQEGKLQSWSHSTTKTRTRKGENLLRCIWGEDLIGLDLFTRSFHFDRKTGEEDYKASEKDYYSILDKNGPTSTKKPRFCVVGANGYGIGMSIACTSKPTRNETSILALLYWPDQDNCSYYTGGDGHPKVFKEPVQAWFKKRWPKGDVEMVKLDHHGSTGENLGKIPHAEDKDKQIEQEEAPLESDTDSEAEMEEENSRKTDDLEIEVTDDQEEAMKDAKEIGIVIDYMKPSKVLVTPGTRHGHPSLSSAAWDVLIILRSYFEELSRGISGQGLNDKEAKGRQGLLSTRSVYWLSKGEVTYKDINFKHVLGAVMQNRLESAEEDSKMLEEKDKKDSKNANKGGQDMEEEDEEVKEGPLRMADAKERIKAQDNWATWRKVYFKYLLDHPNGANYYKKNGDVNKDAVNWDIAEEIAIYDRERKQKKYDKEPLVEGSKEAILYELVGAFWEFIEATDDAQLEGVEDFEEMCWQPLVASAAEDPHFLIRFEFGEQRKDTTLKVFDASGQYEYEEVSKQSEKKGGKQGNKEKSIHEPSTQEENIQRHSKTATGLLTEDENNPWTKHAYGNGDIATMLSDDSFWTIISPRMAARIKKTTKKEVPTVAKSERNMIYKYYDKIKDKAAVNEMMVRETMNRSMSVDKPPDDKEQDLDVGKSVGSRNKRIAKREVKVQPKKEGKGKKETKEGKGKKRK
ncbi:hypothetical protein THAR02_06066 [Trichoderma harzianum]|uniref:Metallo-beta-lactamase domain-containing protein n=1 Tax=Trichoderma harzianum TaxID=5544 RepID=A0A0F9XBC4_TRIHA|nr:hypothetical protein THAR02_06066 [Trichoderma harzianum]